MNKVYLAGPYTHKDVVVMESRFWEHVRCAAWIMKHLINVVVYSPICHNHPIATAYKLPVGWEFWEKYDRTMIEWCDEMWILTLKGWDDSKGVNAEIKIASDLKKPIYFVNHTQDYIHSNEFGAFYVTP